MFTEVINSAPSSSLFGLQIAAATLGVSRALLRRQIAFEAALEAAAQSLAKASLAECVFIEIESNERKWQHAFGSDSPEECVTFGEQASSHGAVRVWIAGRFDPAEIPELDSLARFFAQQVLLRWTSEDLRSSNAALRDQLQIDRESLALRKFMIRAKAIILHRSQLSDKEAEEFLVGASVRSGRPLLQVASDLVLAYGAPDRSFSWSPRYRPRARKSAA